VTSFCVSCVFGHVNMNHSGVALTLERFSDAALCKGYLCLLGTVLEMPYIKLLIMDKQNQFHITTICIRQ